ncbi:NAD-dependent epimerase/dehydratase [Oleiphilus messinensis]|uniref:NAD-dependent epimerase/dehydratase n=1 Tax=Oleiphilus messinensis TaxID=141451 RepID=A0A1Y0IIT5_9GAMM|nr:SDR family oxidoreductase [Oleiphilus messinensis]ARU59343.1 NAD-dependent epimerase/dehydratase [Oleiphilus messinensis]
MSTLVIGANGQIGRLFCQHAAQRNIDVTAMLRNPDQENFFQALDIPTVIADLEGDFEAALSAFDQVVFTAGSGPSTGLDKTLLIDLYGAIRVIKAAEQAGMKQFLMVSALRADKPLEAPEKLQPYMAAKLAADEILLKSEVPFTILRPGRLTDEAATGFIQSPLSDNRDPITITREDVALTMLEVLGQGWAIGKTINLLNGKHSINTLKKLCSLY